MKKAIVATICLMSIMFILGTDPFCLGADVIEFEMLDQEFHSSQDGSEKRDPMKPMKAVITCERLQEVSKGGIAARLTLAAPVDADITLANPLDYLTVRFFSSGSGRQELRGTRSRANPTPDQIDYPLDAARPFVLRAIYEQENGVSVKIDNRAANKGAFVLKQGKAYVFDLLWDSALISLHKKEPFLLGEYEMEFSLMLLEKGQVSIPVVLTSSHVSVVLY